jgi:diacylglycerol kinase (ATP)
LLLLRRARALTASSQHTVLRTFTELAPVEIVRAWGARELYDSLILANVARMAKYGRVSTPQDQTTDCSKTCAAATAPGGASHSWLFALRSWDWGTSHESASSDFVTPQSVPFQIDGEVLHLEAGSQVVVECVPHALTTVG